jgi:gliding motility-associated-like protein
MKKTLNLLLTLSFISSFFFMGQAQNALFSKRILNFSTPAAIFPTKDGGFLLTGIDSNLNKRPNIVLAKLNANGDVLFSKKVDNTNDNSLDATRLKELNDGKLLFTYSNFEKSMIMLLSSDFSTLWSYKLFSNTYTIEDVLIMKNGNIAAMINDGSNEKVTYIIFFDPLGNVLWQKKWNVYKDWIDLNGIIECSDENLLCTVRNSVGLVKIDAKDGSILWSKSYEDPFIAVESDVFSDTFGNVYAFLISATLNFADFRTKIIKLDKDGKEQWCKIIDNSVPFSATQNTDNTFSLFAESGKAYIINIDTDGKILSQSNFPHAFHYFYLSQTKNKKPVLIALKSKDYVYFDIEENCNKNLNLLLQKFSPKGEITCSKPSFLQIRDTVFTMMDFKIPSIKDANLLQKTPAISFSDYPLNIKNYTRFCYQDTLRPSICEGDFVNVGKHKYTKEGMYSDTIPTANHECDSIVFTKLKVNKVYESKQQKTICKGEIFKIGSISCTKSGIYENKFKTQNTCDSVVITDLQVIDLQIETSKDTVIEMGQKAQLWARSPSNDLIWKWSPSATLTCDNCRMPEASPFEFTRYVVQAINSRGCSVEKDIRVSVRPCERIFMPTAFSPNGDNINDTFQAYTSPCIKRIREFSIFDRWGEKVHQVKDFKPNDSNAAWDGTFKDTTQQGVFTYFLQYELLDGTVHQRSGDVLAL